VRQRAPRIEPASNILPLRLPFLGSQAPGLDPARAASSCTNCCQACGVCWETSPYYPTRKMVRSCWNCAVSSSWNFCET